MPLLRDEYRDEYSPRPNLAGAGSNLAAGLLAFLAMKRKQDTAARDRTTFEGLLGEQAGLTPEMASAGPTAGAGAGTAQVPGEAPIAAPGASGGKLGGVMRDLSGAKPAARGRPQPLSELEREIAKSIIGAKYGKTPEEREEKKSEAALRTSQADLNKALTDQIKQGARVEWRDPTTGAVVAPNTEGAVPQLIQPTKSGEKRSDVPQPEKAQTDAKLKKQIALTWIKGMSLKPKKRGVSPLQAPKSQEEAVAVLPRLGVDPNDPDVREAIKLLPREKDMKFIHKFGRQKFPELPTEY